MVSSWYFNGNKSGQTRLVFFFQLVDKLIIFYYRYFEKFGFIKYNVPIEHKNISTTILTKKGRNF